MNIIDIIIAILLGIFAIKGLTKGVINEVFSLIAIVIGLYGSFYFSDITTEYLKGLIDIKPEYLSSISLIVTFIVPGIIIALIGKQLTKLLEAISLGWIDKLAGFVFGVLKGSLIVSLFILLLNILNISSLIPQDKREDSVLYKPVEQIAPYLYQNFDVVRRVVDNSKNLFENGKESIENKHGNTTSC